MNIVCVDQDGNVAHLAKRLSEYPVSKVGVVILISNTVCPKTWETDKLKVVSVTTLTQIEQLVLDHGITLIMNFSPIWGQAGIVEYFKSKKVRCVGSDIAFSKTETEKIAFKHKCIDAGLSVPGITIQGVMSDILSKADQLSFPCVIKPELHFGPYTVVINSRKELDHYFEKIGRQIDIAKMAIQFVVEAFIETKHFLSIHYFIMSGVPVLCVYSKLVACEKTEQNMTGGIYALDAQELANEHSKFFGDVLTFLAKQAPSANATGFAQCIVDQAGRIYLIENNARPITCWTYFHWDDNLFDIVMAFVEGDYMALQQFFPTKGKFQHGAFAMLIHDNPSLKISDEEFATLMATERLNPIGFHKIDDGYESCHGRIPSLFCGHGSTMQETAENFNRVTDVVNQTTGCKFPHLTSNAWL